MIRNLKVLGLVLMAMGAFGALTASAASAQETWGTLTSDGPVTLTGIQTGGTLANAFTAFGGNTTCTGAKYTGHEDITQHETETDPELKHQLIEEPTREITITPHYGLCNTTINEVFHLNFRTTVDMNGCDYTLKFGETVSENTYAVDTFIVCPPGKHIQQTLFSNATTHGENKSFCTVTITHKTEAYKGLHATDTTNGHIDIEGTIEGIASDKGGSFPCPAKPGEEDQHGVLHIDLTLSGDDQDGNKTDIGIWH